MRVESLQPFVHYGFHFLVPGIFAWVLYRECWKKVWLILLATMLVDLDHLWATPLFDPGRCSIGFHPLHSEVAIVVYLVFLLFRLTRLVAGGLLWHMVTDAQDCFWL